MATNRLDQSLLDAAWRPCEHCWGQRRVLLRRAGRGHSATSCPRCLGVGELLAVRATGRASILDVGGGCVLDDAVD